MNETIDMFCPLEGSVLDISHEEEVTLSEATINSELCPVTSTPHTRILYRHNRHVNTDDRCYAKNQCPVQLPPATTKRRIFQIWRSTNEFTLEKSYDVSTNIDNCIPRINVLNG